MAMILPNACGEHGASSAWLPLVAMILLLAGVGADRSAVPPAIRSVRRAARGCNRAAASIVAAAAVAVFSQRALTASLAIPGPPSWPAIQRTGRKAPWSSKSARGGRRERPRGRLLDPERKSPNQADSLTGMVAGTSALAAASAPHGAARRRRRSIVPASRRRARSRARHSGRAGDPAGGPDQQALAHGERALVDAGDLGLVDLGLAVGEAAGLGDLDRPGAVERDLDAALDHQPVAGGDLADRLMSGPTISSLAGGSGAGRGGERRHRRQWCASGGAAAWAAVPTVRRRVGLCGHAFSPLQTHGICPLSLGGANFTVAYGVPSACASKYFNQ